MTGQGHIFHARREGVSWQQVDDEIVVLDLETSRYLSLNGSAALLWKRLVKGPVSVDELSQSLVDAFNVDRDRADDDSADFVRQCADLGLLE